MSAVQVLHRKLFWRWHACLRAIIPYLSAIQSIHRVVFANAAANASNEAIAAVPLLRWEFPAPASRGYEIGETNTLAPIHYGRHGKEGVVFISQYLTLFFQTCTSFWPLCARAGIQPIERTKSRCIRAAENPTTIAGTRPLLLAPAPHSQARKLHGTALPAQRAPP